MKFVSACILLLHTTLSSALPFPQAQTQSAGGSSGGNLGVECKTQKSGDGKYKVTCDGVNKDAIALRSEHILWLQGPADAQSIVDIEIPNYKIAELIKAGFKQSESKGTKINVLLKKPEQSYDAQVDELKPSAGVPEVSLQYEPVDKTVVHFPNDKPYSPLSGPILPPAKGGPAAGATSTSVARPQRQAHGAGRHGAKRQQQPEPVYVPQPQQQTSEVEVDY